MKNTGKDNRPDLKAESKSGVRSGLWTYLKCFLMKVFIGEYGKNINVEVKEFVAVVQSSFCEIAYLLIEESNKRRR